MIPGCDLLSDALSILGTQFVSYFRFKRRVDNEIGNYVTEYYDAVDLEGNLQPVPRQLYHDYGLDLNKIYYTFYASAHILDVQRNISGDKIVFQSNTYICESANDWFAIDGWVGILCVLVNPINQKVFGFSSNNQNFGQGTFDAG